jgi:hypothetical protein
MAQLAAQASESAAVCRTVFIVMLVSEESLWTNVFLMLYDY